MKEIILDEKAWCESVLSRLSLGLHPADTVYRMARYYYSLGYTKKDIQGLLTEFLIRCDSMVNIVRWQNTIEKAAKTSDKRPLIKVDFIPITKREMDEIGKIDGIIMKKVMFSLLCLAKYGNAVSNNNNNWVNFENGDIFKVAGVNINCNRQCHILNSLWKDGYIGFSRIVDNTHVYVRIVDYMSDEVMRITDFRNLGNQYMSHVGDGYFECVNCGLVIKRHNNKSKYCRSCANDMKIINTVNGRKARYS